MRHSRFLIPEAAGFVRKAVISTLSKENTGASSFADMYSSLHRPGYGTARRTLLPQKPFPLLKKRQAMAGLLKNERGEASHFCTVIFIFITVLLLAFIIDLFGIISTKQQLDHCADQMVKQIQLSGGINGETEALFQFLCSQITGADNLSYTVNASYKSPTPGDMNRAIQLGSPFYITITGDAKLGGFWKFNLVHIRIVSKGAGVSEHYWK